MLPLRLLAVAGVLFASPALSTPLTVQQTLSTFNLVTQTYTGNQEVEGRTFIGSDLVNLGSGQFGFQSPSDGALAPDGTPLADLYVDGDLINSQVNLVVGDTAVISGTQQGGTVNNGALIQSATNLPDISFAQYQMESTYLQSLGGTAANLSDQNNKKFNTASIMSVDLADLQSGGYSLDPAATPDGFVIINVSGTSGTFGANALGSKTVASNVLWNFFEATSIQVNAAIFGHVLAPFADMNGFTGSTEGTVIAAAVDLTNGELHQQEWLGIIPEETAPPVPLPAGLPLMLAGLGALGVARRLKSRR